VGPAGVPPHCDSNELPCPADANARIEAQKQFLKLSSTRPRHAVTIVAIPANRAPEPMTKISRRGDSPAGAANNLDPSTPRTHEIRAQLRDGLCG
jgi:hypothetical protein